MPGLTSRSPAGLSEPDASLDPFGGLNAGSSNGNLLNTPGLGQLNGDSSATMSGGALGGIGTSGGSTGTLGMGSLNSAGSTAGSLRERRMKSASAAIGLSKELLCSLLLMALTVFSV